MPPPSSTTGAGKAVRSALIVELQARLDRAADPATRAWFEGYLKNTIRYRGVKTPEVERLVAGWRAESGIADWPPEAGLELACDLIRQRCCEDKLAGILMIQKHLLRDIDADRLLDSIETLLSENAVWEWSTNDWLCARILAPAIRRHGMTTAQRIAWWRTSSNLWQRRAAAVSLRATVKHPEFHPVIAETVACLVPEQERFIQTGVGWLIADLSKHFPDFAVQLVERHFRDLSPEVVRRHLKRLPDHDLYRRRKRRTPGRART